MGPSREGFQVPSNKLRRTATTAKERDKMKRLFASILSVAVFVAFIPVTEAAPCPPEVAQAKELLNKKTSKVQEIQAPRSLAGARGQEQQAPRGQEAQAPRGQETQAPRGQETQAPRGQEMQAPRGQEIQAPRSLAGARGQEQQAPRGQEAQAPRGQEKQAPRGQEMQAPRGQETQAPRGQETQAPRSLAGSKAGGSKAFTLVKEAETACKVGDSATAAKKLEALKILK